MFLAASFCPHPPLLVPACAPGSDAELDTLRSACAAAVAALVDAMPDVVVCIGSAPEYGVFRTDAVGSLLPYGVDVRAGTGTGAPTLPLSLTVGAYLLDHASRRGRRRYIGVPETYGPGACAELGRSLTGIADRVAFLVLGEGSAVRAVSAPGPDEAADAYDEVVTKALATADADALWERESEPADGPVVMGRAARRVAASAVRSTPAAKPVEAILRYAGAPHGVTYPVATWLCEGESAGR